MFGKKKQEGQTVLLLDIENASVGAALARLEEGSAPVLFAEHRTTFSMPRTMRSGAIVKQIEAATHEVLGELGVVAARMRTNQNIAHRGELNRASIFLGAPWGVQNLSLGKPEFAQEIKNFVSKELQTLAHNLPLSFYTGADAATHGTRHLHPEGTRLIAIVRGEIIELVLLGEQGPLGYATVPVGTRHIYRTLQTHGGLSLAEIPAILALTKEQQLHPYYEPLEAASQHMLELFAPSVEALTHIAVPQKIIVVGEEPIGSWFARVLESDDSLGSLFSNDATIHTLGGIQVARQLAGHGREPDLHLALGALFTQGV